MTDEDDISIFREIAIALQTFRKMKGMVPGAVRLGREEWARLHVAGRVTLKYAVPPRTINLAEGCRFEGFRVYVSDTPGIEILEQPR